MIKRKPINRKVDSTYKKPAKRILDSKKRILKRKPKVVKKELEAAQKALVIKIYGNDCYTCPSKNLKGKNCQLGHVPWPRSILSTAAKYDTRFTRCQCMGCNIHRGGMGAKALQRMHQQGINTDALWDFSEETKGKLYPLSWFEEKIKIYQSQLLT